MLVKCTVALQWSILVKNNLRNLRDWRSGEIVESFITCIFILTKKKNRCPGAAVQKIHNRNSVKINIYFGRMNRSAAGVNLTNKFLEENIGFVHYQEKINPKYFCNTGTV